MPCDTVTRFAVKVDKLDPALADAAIASLVEQRKLARGAVVYRDGQLTITGRSDVENVTALVKQSYSAAVVKSTMQRFGWQVQAAGENRFNISKR